MLHADKKLAMTISDDDSMEKEKSRNDEGNRIKMRARQKKDKQKVQEEM